MDVPPRGGDIKLLKEMLLSEGRGPRWRIVSFLLWRLVKCLGELVELLVGEFRWPAWSFAVVERVFEVALFGSVQPAIDRLLMPSKLVSISTGEFLQDIRVLQ